MGSKIAWSGLALSGLGLGFFIKEASMIGTIVLIIGVILIWLDK